MSGTTKKFDLKQATSVRIALAAVLVIIIIGAGVGFWHIRGILVSYATSIASLTAKSTQSNNDLQTLQSLQRSLNTYSHIQQKTSQLTYDKQQYQGNIIRDLNTYAANAGLAISQFTFPASTTGTTGSATSATTAITTPSVGSGITTTQVVITLSSSASYTSLLHFMQYIENSLPKIQLTGLTIASDDKNPGAVTTQSLTLNAYVRSN